MLASCEREHTVVGIDSCFLKWACPRFTPFAARFLEFVFWDSKQVVELDLTASDQYQPVRE